MRSSKSRNGGRGGKDRARHTSSPEFPEGRLPVDFGTVEFELDPSDPGTVLIRLDGVESSHLDLDDPTNLRFEYMQWMAKVIDRSAPAGQPLDVVHLGAAGCAMAAYVEATRPDSRQLAVEIDRELARLVREHLPLPRSPRLRIRVDDARTAIAGQRPASADVVIRDVFADAVTPSHLITQECAQEASASLRPTGIYLVNCVDRPPFARVRREIATLRSVFDSVLVISEPAILKGRRYGNLVLVGLGPAADVEQGPGTLDRALRTAAPPASLLDVEQSKQFAASAAILHDPEQIRETLHVVD